MITSIKGEARPRDVLSYPFHRGYLLGHHLVNSKASPQFTIIQAKDETHGIEKRVPVVFFLMKFGYFFRSFKSLSP